jgi:hypothetical protein
MRTITVSLLSAGLAVALATPSVAAGGRKGTPYYYNSSYAQRFPLATPRQLRNAWAYDHAGQYYEMDSNAFPVGSKGWWELKRLEDGGRKR